MTSHLVSPVLWRAATILGLAVSVALAGDAALRDRVHPAIVEPAQKVDAGEIAKNPGKYYSERVQVTAEVEHVYNAHAFTLDEDMLFAGPDLLVLNPAPLNPSEDGQDLTVTGTLRQFVLPELESEYAWFQRGWLESDDPDRDFTARPVLVADSVKTSEGKELVHSGAHAPAVDRAGDEPMGHEMD